MKTGKNYCPWLMIGVEDRKQCGKRCIEEFCGKHRFIMRIGGESRPCTSCGKGTHNKLNLCKSCGFKKAASAAWRERQKQQVEEGKDQVTLLKI